MKTIKVSIEYDVDVLIDYLDEELFEKEFNKLKSIIESDTEKFIGMMKENNNSNYSKKILYELVD